MTKEFKTDWERIRNMSEAEIQVDAEADPDAQPTTADFWKDAVVMPPLAKEHISIRIDKDILDYFKSTRKRGYQKQINAVLRAYVDAQKKA